MRTPELINIETAIEETNTPVAILFEDIKRAVILITSAGTFNNRSGVLTMQVSFDGETYFDYNMMIPNIANAISEGLTRVGSTTAISTTGQEAAYIIDELLPFKYAKFLFTITDAADPTGNFTIKLYKQYTDLV